MKATILGTSGGYIRSGGANTAILIENASDKVVLDMGAGVLSNLERVCPLDSINNIIITHSHSDHYSDALVAVYGRLISKQLKRDVNVLSFYGPKDLFLCEKLSLENVTTYNEINQKTILQIGSLTLTFYKTVHPIECYAVKCECGDKSIFYTSDTAYSEELIKKAHGCDLLLAECSILKKFGPGNRIGHMNTEDCSAFIKNVNSKISRLVHLPCYGRIEEIENECGFKAAKDLEVIEV